MLLKSNFLQCAGRTVHYLSAGNPSHDCVVIWHGVTGTCRDHEELALRLAKDYFVICPDSIGCGLSDWIQDETFDASLTAYGTIARDLLNQLGVKSCRWIGASKGGGLGIVLADIMAEIPITHLVLNDVGPELPEWMQKAAMKNISNPPLFNNHQEFEQHLRANHAKAGLKLDDEKWQHLAMTWSRRCDNGQVTYHNDPNLALQFKNHKEDFDLWHHFERITIPTLLIKAAKSLVGDEECSAMQSRISNCSLYARSGGHISLMDDPSEQDVIMNFIK